jgi:prolyl 4-hydroxylase
VPEALWHRLQAHYEQHKLAGSVDETTNGDGMKGKPALIAPLVDVADGGSLLRAVQATLQPILEGWAGRALVLQRCHGMRVYREGGALDRHVDWPLSHVVAIILNVAQEGMRSSWPLVIEDHQGREHTLEMSPGEMLLYESARLVHGRPTPLNGTSYVNLFVHFKPKDGWDAASMAQPRWRV